MAFALNLPLLCLGIAASIGAFSKAFEMLGFILVGWVVGGSIGILIARSTLAPIRWRRAYASHKLLQNPLAYSWNTDGFTTKNEYGGSSIPWSKFLKFREDEQTFLLYVSKMQFFCIPKRAFSDEVASREFSDMLRQHVGA